MKIRIDAESCQGHQMCAIAAPSLFESDDYGYAHEIGDGVVPAGMEAKARLAAGNCPERAVIIEE